LFVNPTRLLVTCGIVLSTLLAAGCSRIPDTVRIGVAQPLSGPQGPRGNDMKNGVQLAVDELNAKGFQIDGHPVRLEVVAVDDQSDAVAGRAAARLLVDADVIAVVGHLDSAVSIAAAPVYAEAGIPQLAIATQPGYTQQNLPTTFRLVASATQESKALGSFAATQIAGRRFAVVDDGLPYGRGLADQAANEIRRSGKPVAVRTSLPDGGDCAALLAQLKAAQVDVLVATLADGQLAGLIPHLVQAGLGGLQIVGSDTTKTERLPPAASGVRALFRDLAGDRGARVRRRPAVPGQVPPEVRRRPGLRRALRLRRGLRAGGGDAARRLGGAAPAADRAQACRRAGAGHQQHALPQRRRAAPRGRQRLPGAGRALGADVAQRRVVSVA
jgi:ABC-type branched-subunit amino acid transport system substrate-binding protein